MLPSDKVTSQHSWQWALSCLVPSKWKNKATSHNDRSEAFLPNMLNYFYIWFEEHNDARKSIPPPENKVLCRSAVDIRRTTSRVNPLKATRPDNIPGWVLMECSHEHLQHLPKAGSHAKLSTIIPKTYLNDYHIIALTSVIIKCFKKMVMVVIRSHFQSHLTHTSLHITYTGPLMMLYIHSYI